MFLVALLLAYPEPQTERRISELIERLGSDRVEERERATRELKSVGEAALPELRKAARERGGEIASRAADLVHWNEVQKALTPKLRELFPGLERRLLDREPDAWESVFGSLKDDPDPELDDLSDRERGLVYERALREASTDRLRAEILEEAAIRPAPLDGTLAAAFLSSPDADLRGAAAKALGATGGTSGAAALRAALEDRDDGVRWRAAEALGRLGVRDAAQDLRRLASRPPYPVATAAVLALGRMGAREAERDLRALRSHEQAALRGAAAFALADLGVDDGPSLLGAVLRGEEFPDQLEAAERLTLMGLKAVPALRECLGSPNAPARRLAAEALGKIGATEAGRELEALFGDREWSVRESAADALGRLRAKEAAPGLRKLLRDPAPFVQITAATSLCALGDEAGASLLLAEARNRHRLVQQVIPLTALNALREPAAWKRLDSQPLAAPLEGRTRRVLQRYCEAARLTLELSDSDSDMDDADAPWRERRLSARPDGRRTLFQVLLGIRGNGAYDFILEPDRLRVVPHSEAIRFWSEWWKTRAGK